VALDIVSPSLPLTSVFPIGDVTPIPTFPELLILSRSLPAKSNVAAGASASTAICKLYAEVFAVFLA
jgi:hypothetical protein